MQRQGDSPYTLPWCPQGALHGIWLTRAAAERLGVVAEPEVVMRHLGATTAFVVLASDGVSEFMSNQEVVDKVSACAHPVA